MAHGWHGYNRLTWVFPPLIAQINPNYGGENNFFTLTGNIFQTPEE